MADARSGRAASSAEPTAAFTRAREGPDPITAGVKLGPLAIGMLVASPLAGLWADRHGSRALSTGGMLVSAAGLVLMTTLDVHTPYWQGMVWLTIVGIGSGMFNSPNTAAMMGVVPSHRRGIAAGARMMLQNTGAALSIAFVLAVITNAVPRDTLVPRASRRGCRTSASRRSFTTCTRPCGRSP